MIWRSFKAVVLFSIVFAIPVMAQEDVSLLCDSYSCQPPPTEGIWSPQGNSDGSELVDTHWVLTWFNGRAVLPKNIITLRFGKNETGTFITGVFGDNHPYGFFPYTVQSNFRLTIKDGSCNQTDCPQDGSLESEYFRTLIQDVTQYQIVESTLVLINNKGKSVLGYRSIPEPMTDTKNLEGKVWQLTSITGMEKFRDYYVTVFSLRFDDGEIIGETGCNSYVGTYHASDGVVGVLSLRKALGFSFLKQKYLLTDDVSGFLNHKKKYEIPRSLLDFSNHFCSEKQLNVNNVYLSILKNALNVHASEGYLEISDTAGRALLYKLAD